MNDNSKDKDKLDWKNKTNLQMERENNITGFPAPQR